MKISLTMDVNLLLSIINTKLRNDYKSLTELCDDLNLDEKELKDRLKHENYIYNEKQNQFINNIWWIFLFLKTNLFGYVIIK